MTRVRLAESALDDLQRQLTPSALAQFVRFDLAPTIEFLGSEPNAWRAMSAAHGPGRRLTVSGVTVAGFHLFAVDDPNVDGASIVVYLIDVWTEEFPE